MEKTFMYCISDKPILLSFEQICPKICVLKIVYSHDKGVFFSQVDDKRILSF